MTLLSIIERVTSKFPNITPMEIVNDVNRLQKEFAEETRILVKVAALSGYSQTTVTYNLPADLCELESVTLKDSLGNDLGDELVSYSVNNGQITFYGIDGYTITEMPTDIASIDLEYTYYPATLDAQAEVPEIPEQFHDFLIWGLFDIYGAGSNTSKEWSQRKAQILARGKVYANKRKQFTEHNFTSGVL